MNICLHFFCKIFKKALSWEKFWTIGVKLIKFSYCFRRYISLVFALSLPIPKQTISLSSPRFFEYNLLIPLYTYLQSYRQNSFSLRSFSLRSFSPLYLRTIPITKKRYSLPLKSQTPICQMLRLLYIRIDFI